MIRMARTCAGLLACALTLVPAVPAHADTVSDGFSLEVLSSPAAPGSLAVTLPGGDFVTFDGQSIDRWAADGSFLGNLGLLPAFGFPSFLRLDPQGTALVLGESSQHGIWTVPLSGAGPAPLATLKFNFDAVFDLDGSLIVSADTDNGPAGTNELVRVDVGTGATTSLGSVLGYSGPVAVAPNGDLYYATSEFPMPASTKVLSWSAAQHHGGAVLSNANASIVASGFEGGFSLAFDPDTGELYLAEVNFSLGVYRAMRVDGGPAQSTVVAQADHPLGGLQFVQQGGPGTFAPYQPGLGTVLKYTAGDTFQGVWHHATVRPRQPGLTLSGPGLGGVGPVTLTMTDGVPNGAAFLVFCQQSLLSPSLTGWPFNGFQWYTRFDPSRTRRVNFFLPTDASGTTTFTLHNPGNLQGKWAYQFLVATPSGQFVGASKEGQF